MVVFENRVVFALVVVSCARLVCTEATDVLLTALDRVVVEVALRSFKEEEKMVLKGLRREVEENETF